jgi:hypothetical protein
VLINLSLFFFISFLSRPLPIDPWNLFLRILIISLMNSPMTLKVQSKASKPMKQYTRKHDTALKAVSSSVGEAGLNYWRVYSRRQALRRVLHSKIQAVQQTLRFERKTREMRETSTSPATLTNSRSESCTHGAVMYACANPFRKRPETVMVRAT